MKTERQYKAFEFLNNKYGDSSFFSERTHQRFVSFESEFKFISQYTVSKDVESNIRVFFDSANNLLEELFKVTYEDYKLQLRSQLSEERVFENIENEKVYSSKRAYINKYFEVFNATDTFSEVIQAS